jgi:hypothetical protein
MVEALIMICSFDNLVRRTLRTWQIWRDKRTAKANYRRLLKQYPELARIDQAQAEARRKHKAHEHFDKTREAAVAALLRGEA